MHGGGGDAGVGDPPRLNIVSAVLLKQDFEVLTMYKTLGKVVEYKAGKEREEPFWGPYWVPKTPSAGQIRINPVAHLLLKSSLSGR